MKLKVKELKQIIQEALNPHGLDGFRKSENFKAQVESIINTLNEFSSKTPVGFFDAYNNEYDVDFYKSFHDFYEGVSEVYNNLFKTGGEVHVGEKGSSQNIEHDSELKEEEPTQEFEEDEREFQVESKKRKRLGEGWQTLNSSPLFQLERNYLNKHASEYYILKFRDENEEYSDDREYVGNDYDKAIEKYNEYTKVVPRESKIIEGAEPDLASWEQEKVESYWETFKKNHKSWEDKVSAVSKFSSNPEAFVSALEKRATGEIADKGDK